MRMIDADALSRVVKLAWDTSDSEDFEKSVFIAIATAPTIEPEPRWIPCSERLPGKDEPFYVLCCDKHGEIMIGHVFACNDGETPYSAESEHEYMYDCVAWCPLPEPWKGEKP